MEQAREFTTAPVGAVSSGAAAKADGVRRRPETVVLQVDATISAIDGLAWLVERRDASTRDRLRALHREAVDGQWSWGDLARGRLALLRPRRAEVTELGAAYLAALVPGAVDAASRLRRAGISLALASDVAADALFGVAHALGIAPDALRAPRLRFDALGSFTGCELPDAPAADDLAARRPDTSATVFVGTRRPVMFASPESHDFVAFSGVVAVEDARDAKGVVDGFPALVTLLLR